MKGFSFLSSLLVFFKFATALNYDMEKRAIPICKSLLNITVDAA